VCPGGFPAKLRWAGGCDRCYTRGRERACHRSLCVFRFRFACQPSVLFSAGRVSGARKNIGPANRCPRKTARHLGRRRHFRSWGLEQRAPWAIWAVPETSQSSRLDETGNSCGLLPERLRARPRRCVGFGCVGFGCVGLGALASATLRGWNCPRRTKRRVPYASGSERDDLSKFRYSLPARANGMPVRDTSQARVCRTIKQNQIQVSTTRNSTGLAYINTNCYPGGTQFDRVGSSISSKLMHSSLK
jgi:hypothetical protein